MDLPMTRDLVRLKECKRNSTPWTLVESRDGHDTGDLVSYNVKPLSCNNVD